MALFVMGDAFAQTVRDEWSVIRNDKRISIVMPKFTSQFGYGGIFNICHENGEFKSIKPVMVCNEHIDIRTGIPNSDIGETVTRKCIRASEMTIYLPRITSQQVCSKREVPTEDSANKCIVWRNETTTMPLNYMLDVIYSKGTEKFGDLKFRKTYTIPNCSFL
jgi:hypothetical protein